MKLFDTNLPHIYSKSLFDEWNTDLGYNHTDLIAEVTMLGTATILNAKKTQDHPVAMTFTRFTDNSVVAAGIVQFFPGESEEEPGHWNLTFTLDQADIPSNAEIVDIQNPATHSYFRGIAGEKHFTYKNPEKIIVLPTVFFECLRKWLDENAKENEEVSLEIDGILTARVAVEGGEKVFALEPDGEIKVMIKDDTAIEK